MKKKNNIKFDSNVALLKYTTKIEISLNGDVYGMGIVNVKAGF
ncbi:hypothetical protein [Chryseobacterium sp. MEBOG07]|nr:hypothetical protein [Chryseobacterium sp. MEBOG07]